MRYPQVAAGLAIALIGLASCRSEAPEISAPPTHRVSVHKVSLRRTTFHEVHQKVARDRKDTPWQTMTDEDFGAQVTRAGGSVIIGFKDAGAPGGVDNNGRVIASAAGAQTAAATMKSLGIKALYEFKRIPAIVAVVPAALALNLRRNPVVDYIEPSLPGQYASQSTPWGVTKIFASTAWNLGATGSGVKLLFLDSGVDSTARDLTVSVGFRCINPGYIYDHFGHGTMTAGVAAALNNTTDVVGAAYGVTLWSANIDDVAYQPGTPSPAQAACAVDIARINAVAIVNMSFVLPGAYTSLTDEINGGYNSDNVLFVAAAGNTNGGSVGYPANLSNVIAATATDSNNAASSGAAVGPEIDIAAPGVAILTTSMPSSSICRSGGYTTVCTGTSFSAPYVSAAAALLKSRYTSWSNATIRARLLSTAIDLGSSGFDNTYGNGLLNIAEAIGLTVRINGIDLV